MTNKIHESFGAILNILQALGLYHKRTESKLFKVRSYVLYCLGAALPVLALISFIKGKDLNRQKISQLMAFFPEAVTCYLKLIPFLIKGPRIKKCVEYFADRRFVPRDGREREIIDECVEVCRRNVSIYVPSLIFVIVFWNSFPLLANEHRLPIEIWLPFDVLSREEVFWLAYIYIFAGFFYIALGGELLEPLIGGLTYHATAQMKILKYNLENLEKFAKNHSKNSNVKFEEVTETLRRCITHHNDILHFVQELENCFSWCVFWQMAGAFFGLCFYCVALVTDKLASFNGIMYISSYFITTFQICFYCHYGTLLFEENEKLTSAIYMGPWYEYDVKVRKILIMMMERSKKPMLLTAGKLIKLTYVTLTSLIKTSYSLVAIMSTYIRS